MNEYVDLLSKIVIWGGIAFVILFIILKALGIVKSPFANGKFTHLHGW